MKIKLDDIRIKKAVVEQGLVVRIFYSDIYHHILDQMSPAQLAIETAKIRAEQHQTAINRAILSGDEPPPDLDAPESEWNSYVDRKIEKRAAERREMLKPSEKIQSATAWDWIKNVFTGELTG